MSTPEREYRTCLELGLPDTYNPAKMGLIIQGIANALIEINDKVEGNTDTLPTVNDGVLTLTDSLGNIVGTFSANQAADVALSLPAGAQKQADYAQTDVNEVDYIKNKPVEAPNDGNVYVRNGQTESWVRGLPYDVSTLPELP